MGTGKRPPLGVPAKARPRASNDRASVAARRKWVAPSPSPDSDPGEQSGRPLSAEEEEQEDPPEGSSPMEDANDAHEDEPKSPPRQARKHKQHTGVIKAGRRHSRDQVRTPSRSAPQRHRRRDSGAAASGARDGPYGDPRDAPMPHLPRPPLAPPPPSIRRSVTLQAKAEAEEPAAPPPPPAGPSPDDYLRLAVAFRNSLDDLEITCAGIRGQLDPIKHLVSLHIMKLRCEFRLAC